MTGGIDGRDYLIAAERNLKEALRLGTDGRGLARLALNYLEKAVILIRAKKGERPFDGLRCIG